MKMYWLSIFNRQYSLITTHFLCANLLAVCNSFQSNMSSMCLTLLRKNEQILTWGTFPDPGICWHLLTSADYLEFCLDACKKRRYLRVFQKIEEVWCEQNPVNNSVLSTSKDKKLRYLPGFLPSDSAKCCKLRRFVRCLCSISKRAMLSHVLGILQLETTLQIETRRQCGPKQSCREGTRR